MTPRQLTPGEWAALIAMFLTIFLVLILLVKQVTR
jgi:hypothetical protein